MPDITDSPEVHIASFIVHFHNAQRDSLERFLKAEADLEVQPSDPPGDGRLVVVCEGPHQGHILDRMDAIEQVPGVLGCSLVYHEVMSAREAEQELISEVISG
ncbi:periplasmic nitrate reductase chaperone NapD [Marinobacter daqiaonensis]|uniref:Chaperone NapD n=1 Tax=Marinobacter daqiaonensis TaxID=650891 RepID=A0A1I6IKZ1_9GAMM|nr:chaperone NapD [Marinobacter daqiaonensis]SFR67402.1 periplasmic nitrate reductase chaperone NapD [Marinobacter daqiaonensis]